MKILFVCVNNSARSQIAEALARDAFDDSIWIESAGSNPQTIDLNTSIVMKEIGVGISEQYAKSYRRLSQAFIEDLDYVVSVGHEEIVPSFRAPRARRLRWRLPDPCRTGESDKLEVYRETRDAIAQRIHELRDEIALTPGPRSPRSEGLGAP